MNITQAWTVNEVCNIASYSNIRWRVKLNVNLNLKRSIKTGGI